jgi:hypothetical protein
MSGTPIENLRYMPQMQQQMQPQFQQPMPVSTNMPETDLVNDDLRRQVNMDMFTREVTDTLDDVMLPEQQMQPMVQQMPPHLQQQKMHRINRNLGQDDGRISNIKNGIMKNIPDYLREPLIIFVIYMILSLDIVKKALASYIPQLKPSSDGNVQLLGIAVYGMVLGIIYSVAKKLLL